MAVVGLTMVRLALVDSNTQKIITGDAGLSTSGLYEVDVEDLGTKTANIAAMEGTVTPVFGNNKKTDVMVGISEPTVTLDINALDVEVSKKCLGYVWENGGYVYSGNKPHIALSVETKDTKTGKRLFFNFGNGIMSQAAQNVGTNTQNQTRNDDNLTYNALTTDAFGDEPMKIYYSGKPDFDYQKMLNETFGGYKVAQTSSFTTTTTKAES